jgi:hypothetical protein
MLRLLLFFLAGTMLSSCYPAPSPIGRNFEGIGYRPVYMSHEDVVRVSTGPAEPLSDPGKIYLLEPYLFVNERGKGIHVIDNSDPKNPINLSFLSIPGNMDMAAKGNWLYVDNYKDLLTFDISDPRQIILVKRSPNVIPIRDYPIQSEVFFECPDPDKGVIVAWEKTEMDAKPDCWR